VVDNLKLGGHLAALFFPAASKKDNNPQGVAYDYDE